MRTTAKQRRAAQDAKWCEQYRKTNWDGCAANDYFARQCHPDPGAGYLNKPRHIAFERLREMEIAVNWLYFQIAPLSFQKEKVVDYLSQLDKVSISVPQDIIHNDLYVNTYLEKANEILANIQRQHYDFQK